MLLVVSLVVVSVSPVAGASPPEYRMFDLGLTEPGSDASGRVTKAMDSQATEPRMSDGDVGECGEPDGGAEVG